MSRKREKKVISYRNQLNSVLAHITNNYENVCHENAILLFGYLSKHACFTIEGKTRRENGEKSLVSVSLINTFLSLSLSLCYRNEYSY